ncbi:hypothetical protein H5410_050889, partial [Solanum commersonii]
MWQQLNLLLVLLPHLTSNALFVDEMTYNIDVQTSKKISQPLKWRRLKKSISRSLYIISFTIPGEDPTELMSSFSQWINKGLYKYHAKRRDKDDHYLVNCSKLGFNQFDFVVAFLKKKD